MIKKQQNVYHADSKIGKAFLKVGKYVTENYSKPVNLEWNVKPYKATASFDDKDGHHNVVCYVDNKNELPRIKDAWSLSIVERALAVL